MRERRAREGHKKNEKYKYVSAGQIAEREEPECNKSAESTGHLWSMLINLIRDGKGSFRIIHGVKGGPRYNFSQEKLNDVKLSS